MNLLLRLAKVESPEIKIHVSFALLALTSAISSFSSLPSTSGTAISLKILKQDAMDVLFWLTLHDCLQHNDSIKKNVGRILRNFTCSEAEAEILAKEERFISVLKSLTLSRQEDVLWQAAGAVYNVLGYESCQKLLLSKGILTYIFRLAYAGHATVRHLCSASLHLLQAQLPDMEDPKVLQLLWCLLEGDGEKLSELKERAPMPLEDLPSSSSSSTTAADKNGDGTYGSAYLHERSAFEASWLPLICEVDHKFTVSCPIGLPTCLSPLYLCSLLR
jgi:hypothetical protein